MSHPPHLTLPVAREVAVVVVYERLVWGCLWWILIHQNAKNGIRLVFTATHLVG